jgi:hypothetical protein
VKNWQKSGDVAEAVVDDVRACRIDTAVSAAGELIGLLMTKGPVTPAQARLIVEATVRSAVPNFEGWEIRDSASRIVAEGVGENGDRAAG